MARVDVIMPQMGESIAEGTLSRWLKKAGDEVRRDEPIFEISTDKVDAEIPSPVAGVLAEILVKEGETVAVQTVVARIETEKGAAVTAEAPSPAPAATASAPRTAMAPAAAPPAPAPAMPAHAAPMGGSAGNGSSFEERVQTRSSPLVRKIAAEHGVDLASLRGRGSGIAGRVTKKDILGFIESGPPATAGAAPSMHAPGGGSHGPAASAWPGDVVEPMTKMRALISEHMGASRRTSAHVTSFMEIDLTRVSKIRAKKKAEFHAATGQNLTYLPFIIAAVIDGLKKFPVMNSSVSGNNIIYRKQYNIAIAVALDWGLIVPVIKQADNLSLAGLTRALNDLAARARAKRLSPEEVQDGTFTITNPGVFGSLMGTPIINQPQVAILGVGAIEKRPKVVAGPDGDDVLAIRTCAYFSLSFDHRIIDGAVADQFLAHVKATLENFSDAGV
ncbi:MAG TPA: dihydrolipoamide acetyltransferase family protein [Gemmatimonadaceae bacterium]|nr:dihydrolipoamide acetyltransferase family protein [Gemmatimonadaceae bacterium]